jgi:hypothetical protein
VIVSERYPGIVPGRALVDSERSASNTLSSRISEYKRDCLSITLVIEAK